MWESPEWTCELGNVEEGKEEEGVGCSSQEATDTKRKVGNQPDYIGKSLWGMGRPATGLESSGYLMGQEPLSTEEEEEEEVEVGSIPPFKGTGYYLPCTQG